jgi:uncharacterized protein YceH (UPF0502 family)
MEFQVRLNKVEARVFGCLIEKAFTTPDNYPLTLAAVTAAANQKTNRDPVMELDEVEVARALDALANKFLARRQWPANSRVEKFSHNGKDVFSLEAGPLAVLAELLLRGPQTSGELRVHVSRMVTIDSLESLYAMLQPLIERGLVERLPPAPGSRAERYAQLLSPDVYPTGNKPIERSDEYAALQERVKDLESRLARAERQIVRLAEKLGMSLEALAQAGREDLDLE